MSGAAWTRENYEKSVTSRCWSCTPCDAGWEEGRQYGVDVATSPELRAIFEEEMALGSVPEWAVEVVDRMLDSLPMCGHYSFPQPVLSICEAIRQQRCPDMVRGHYTADPDRKRLMSYYVYCLDAWLQGAALEVARAELAMRDDLGKDWGSIVEAIYEALGARCGPKALLVRRLIHRQRWWIKTLIWPGDQRDMFMLDTYSGDARGDEAEYGAYGNPPFGDPYFAELRVPEVEDMSGRIREMGDEELLGDIEHSHLCAPKAFRHLEKRIIAIGRMGSESVAEEHRPILQCEDTYPDFSSYKAWYESFMSSLSAWLEGDAEALPALGDVAPAGHWLARILRYKLQLYEEHNPFGRLVGAKPGGRSGTKTI